MQQLAFYVTMASVMMFIASATSPSAVSGLSRHQIPRDILHLSSSKTPEQRQCARNLNNERDVRRMIRRTQAYAEAFDTSDFAVSYTYHLLRRYASLLDYRVEAR
jgi:hypothetical protein